MPLKNIFQNIIARQVIVITVFMHSDLKRKYIFNFVYDLLYDHNYLNRKRNNDRLQISWNPFKINSLHHLK